MGLQPFYGKGQHLLLLAGLWTTCGKITVNGIPNHLNYCVIFMVYSQFKMWQSGGPQVGDPYPSHLLHCITPDYIRWSLLTNVLHYPVPSSVRSRYPNRLLLLSQLHSLLSDVLQHHTLQWLWRGSLKTLKQNCTCHMQTNSNRFNLRLFVYHFSHHAAQTEHKNNIK